MHEPLTDHLASSPTAPGLAAQAARLAAAPDCRGLGRQRSRGQPVDAARPRRRPGGPALSASPWSAPAARRRPAGASARAVAPRRRGLWLPRPRVDLWPGRRHDAPGGGRLLSSRPCGPLADSAALAPTTARTAGSAARRSGPHPPAGGDLACTQRGAHAQGQTLFCRDASGLSPLPSVARTSAPLGPTPSLQAWWTRGPLPAIRAIAPAGQRYFHSQDGSLESEAVVAFREHRLREVPGQLVSIWGGAPMHRGHRLTAFLADGAAQRLPVARLPAYAPELHPGAGLGAPLQGVERRKVCCCTVRHLHHALREAVKRGRRTPRLIPGCCRGAKL
jgi:hypothetical protein